MDSPQISSQMRQMEKKQKVNRALFTGLSILFVGYLGFTIAIGASKAKDYNPYNDPSYTETYIEQIDGILQQESELVDEYERLEKVSTSHQEEEEQLIMKIREVERSKFNFLRKYYQAPRGFSVFHSESYFYSLMGYHSISKYSYKWSQDPLEKRLYEEGKLEFRSFINKSKELKIRFEENKAIYKKTIENKEEIEDEFLDSIQESE